MPEGTLEVNLVSAKGLENTDVLFNMDPCVILSYKTQEKKSNVASGKGSNPEWNKTFLFNISSSDSTDLKIKMMDSDTGSVDDLVGHASIPLNALFHDGDIPAKSYNVMKDDAYCGETESASILLPREVEILIQRMGTWADGNNRAISYQVIRDCIYDLRLSKT